MWREVDPSRDGSCGGLRNTHLRVLFKNDWRSGKSDKLINVPTDLLLICAIVTLLCYATYFLYRLLLTAHLLLHWRTTI